MGEDQTPTRSRPASQTASQLRASATNLVDDADATAREAADVVHPSLEEPVAVAELPRTDSLAARRRSSVAIPAAVPIPDTRPAVTDPRRMRRVIAEDPEWNVALVPRLVDLCVAHIVANFAKNPLLTELPPKYRTRVLDQLSTDVPLHITAPLIAHEGYWQRCCAARWKINDVAAHGGSWKQAFFERNLDEYIEKIVPNRLDSAEMAKLLRLSAPFVTRLDIRQLLPPARDRDGRDFGGRSAGTHPPAAAPSPSAAAPAPATVSATNSKVAGGVAGRGGSGAAPAEKGGRNASSGTHNLAATSSTLSVASVGAEISEHDEEEEGSGDDGDGRGPQQDHVNLAAAIEALPQLRELSLTYGVRHCGMNFDWSLFGMTIRDCQMLARTFKTRTPALTTLRLYRSSIDDARVRILISHLLDHPALRVLDLSHNKIGDSGARAVAKLLKGHSKLVTLDLCDNQIQRSGGNSIGRSLEHNTTLESLNLRLNRLGDAGGRALVEGLARNNTLKSLNIGSNSLGIETATALGALLRQNTSLEDLDITCNKLGPEGGKLVQDGAAGHKRIRRMDVRLTDIGQENEYCIAEMLKANAER